MHSTGAARLRVRHAYRGHRHIGPAAPQSDSHAVRRGARERGREEGGREQSETRPTCSFRFSRSFGPLELVCIAANAAGRESVLSVSTFPFLPTLGRTLPVLWPNRQQIQSRSGRKSGVERCSFLGLLALGTGETGLDDEHAEAYAYAYAHGGQASSCPHGSSPSLVCGNWGKASRPPSRKKESSQAHGLGLCPTPFESAHGQGLYCVDRKNPQDRWPPVECKWGQALSRAMPQQERRHKSRAREHDEDEEKKRRESRRKFLWGRHGLARLCSFFYFYFFFILFF